MNSDHVYAAWNKALFTGYHHYTFAERFRNWLLLKEVRKVAKSSSSSVDLLDVGCGEGYFLRDALAAGFSARGVDPVRRGLTLEGPLADAFDEADFITWNPPKKFHVVVCSETLEHLPSYLAAVAKLNRCLTARGTLLVTVPNEWPFEVERCPRCGEAYERQGHVWRWDAEALKSDLSAFFERVDVRVFYSKLWDAVDLFFSNSGRQNPLKPGIARALDGTARVLFHGRYLLARASRPKSGVEANAVEPNAENFRESAEFRRVKSTR